jgi:hypothetical protein
MWLWASEALKAMGLLLMAESGRCAGAIAE